MEYISIKFYCSNGHELTEEEADKTFPNCFCGDWIASFTRKYIAEVDKQD